MRTISISMKASFLKPLKVHYKVTQVNSKRIKSETIDKAANSQNPKEENFNFLNERTESNLPKEFYKAEQLSREFQELTIDSQAKEVKELIKECKDMKKQYIQEDSEENFSLFQLIIIQVIPLSMKKFP